MFGEIRNAAGERLDSTTHPGRGDAVVVIGHGVTGNKDRPFLVALAAALEEAGITALRFSFSGNGGSEGRFADCTISKEVDDLGCVLAALGERPVAVVGHSMGSAVAVLRAARDRRIRWLVSLAGMVHTAAFAAREFGDVTPGAGCMWEDPHCPLSRAFVDDLTTIDSVADAGAEVRVPWLLVHGSQDDVVPLEEARHIAARGPRAELVVLDGADHVFSDHTPAMAGTVVAWLTRQLGGTTPTLPCSDAPAPDTRPR